MIQINKEFRYFLSSKNHFLDWFYQRKDIFLRISIIRIYIRGLLFLFPFSQFLFFWFSSILLFVFYPDLIVIYSLFSFRIVLYYIVYFPIMKKLRHFDLFFIYPVMEFLSLFVQLFFVLLNIRYKTNSWK